ncbi:hypothetical protein ACQSSU_20495 [Micromonospora echinospora]
MPAVDVRAVAALIGGHRYRYADEYELQDGIDQVLRTAGIVPVREARLAGRDRVDLLLPDGIGVEVKVDGQAGAVRRQLARYASHPSVRVLLLVTTRARHLQGLPAEIAGVPVLSVLLRGGI